MDQVNKVIIVSGASGSGKSTLVNYLLSNKELNLQFSVSVCSRNKRPHEIEGKHYIFTTIKKFKEKIKSNSFLEWEEVYKNRFYGTLKSETMAILDSGKNIIFDLDVKGAHAIKKYFKHRAIGVFIQAPSKAIMKERLIDRSTDSLPDIKIRIDKMEDEVVLGQSMDHVIVNDNLNITKNTIYSLIKDFLKS